MNTYLYRLGAFTLAFAIGGVPIVALANESTSTLEVSRTNMQVESRAEFKNSDGSARSFEELKSNIERREKEMEIKMHSRGFLTRLFFGGDKDSAEIISQMVKRNQELIESLTKILDQANISADMRVTLNVQIKALEDAQIRLMNLSTKERHSWGMFSWRFSGK